MSYFHRVFCRSSEAITRREIAEFIAAGSFFDSEPGFDPPPDSAEAADLNWGRLAVHYEPDGRPVTIERNVEDPLAQEEVRELLFVITKAKETQARQNVERAIRAAAQVYRIGVNRETASDDCWEMLDSVQAFLAGRCAGIVYAPDDGFFDEKLRPLYRL
jgi:hypothetical protein